MEFGKNENTPEPIQNESEKIDQTLAKRRWISTIPPAPNPETAVPVQYEVPGQGFIDLLERYHHLNPQKQDPISKK